LSGLRPAGSSRWRNAVRTWFSLVAIMAVVVYVEPARADSPTDVYSDFATDGILSCGHSRSALTGVLSDASLYQYGDPLTFLQLKLAIRRQLARGCRGRRAADPEGANSSGTGAAGGTGSTMKATKKQRRPSRSVSGARGGSRTAKSEEVERGGAMVILGAGLLLLALGSGGWAAKRAFSN
jgi:hypothetical protein